MLVTLLFLLKMKLNAIGVSTSNMQKSLDFYTILGFKFPEINEEHTESQPDDGSAKLMIDKKEIIKKIMGTDPIPSNHSNFAVQFDSKEEVNSAAKRIEEAGFKIIKKPWDAFWGQRYCIIEDPDGYKLDLYAKL